MTGAMARERMYSATVVSILATGWRMIYTPRGDSTMPADRTIEVS